MLAYHRRPVCLSLVSTDLPVWSAVETAATLYQRDGQRFHLLLSEPLIQGGSPFIESATTGDPNSPRLLWLEISPYRAMMTMQHSGQFNYRHLWEQGVYGLSRYWLREGVGGWSGQMRLRNFTRSLKLSGHPLPHYFRLEYELWADKVRLGHYVLSLDIHH